MGEWRLGRTSFLDLAQTRIPLGQAPSRDMPKEELLDHIHALLVQAPAPIAATTKRTRTPIHSLVLLPRRARPRTRVRLVGEREREPVLEHDIPRLGQDLDGPWGAEHHALDLRPRSGISSAYDPNQTLAMIGWGLTSAGEKMVSQVATFAPNAPCDTSETLLRPKALMVAPRSSALSLIEYSVFGSLSVRPQNLPWVDESVSAAEWECMRSGEGGGRGGERTLSRARRG